MCITAASLAKRRRAVLEAITAVTVIDLTDGADGECKPKKGTITPSLKRHKWESFPLRIELLKLRVDGEIRTYACERSSELWVEVDERLIEFEVEGRRYTWKARCILQEGIVALGGPINLDSVDEVVVRLDVGYLVWFTLKLNQKLPPPRLLDVGIPNP